MADVTIDGSFGEGGGEILRTSLALSAMTGKSLEIFNIRARRKKPGLFPQHLKSVHAAAEICGAGIQGAELGSQTLQFFPGKIRHGDFRFEIGTAGSTGLVLHTVYLPLMIPPDGSSTVAITGGTHVIMSPCYHYLDLQWRPFLQEIGVHIDLQMKAAGYYPRGGGEIVATIKPSESLGPLTITERGALTRISGISSVTNLPLQIAERQKAQAEKRLSGIDQPVEIEIQEISGVGKGTMLLLVAEFEHSQACYYGLGERGKRAETVADEAVDQVLELLQGPGHIDEHLADQLVLPLAVSDGTSEFITPKVTQHLITNIAVIQRFLPIEASIDGYEGRPGTITITGTGMP